MLPLDPAAVPPFARVERGARGLRLAPAPAPEGAVEGVPSLRAAAGAPAGVRDAVVVADGGIILAVGSGAGVAFTIAAPRMHVVHDRRPPGLDRVLGAPGANAGLLHGVDGWRAVVLPSLGDVASGLGPGPVAIRADGRRLALLDDGIVVEHDLGGESPAARHEGGADALAYLADGSLLVATGSRLGPPGAGRGDGPAIVGVATASAAPRAAALHEDGTVSVWEAGADAPLATWPAPIAAETVALSADGAQVALGTPTAAEPVAVMARAEDGATLRRIDGARVISPTPDPTQLAVGGDWGVVWLKPLEEDA
jgi:hypothetical protein